MKIARQSIFMWPLFAAVAGLLFYIELHDPYAELYRHELIRIVRSSLADMPVFRLFNSQ